MLFSHKKHVVFFRFGKTVNLFRHEHQPSHVVRVRRFCCTTWGRIFFLSRIVINEVTWAKNGQKSMGNWGCFTLLVVVISAHLQLDPGPHPKTHEKGRAVSTWEISMEKTRSFFKKKHVSGQTEAAVLVLSPENMIWKNSWVKVDSCHVKSIVAR